MFSGKDCIGGSGYAAIRLNEERGKTVTSSYVGWVVLTEAPSIVEPTDTTARVSHPHGSGELSH